jgi:hypothetical protein
MTGQIQEDLTAEPLTTPAAAFSSQEVPKKRPIENARTDLNGLGLASALPCDQ